MDHDQTPEERANEERTVKPDGDKWTVVDVVEHAVSGLILPRADDDCNAEQNEQLREQNDAEQRR